MIKLENISNGQLLLKQKFTFTCSSSQFEAIFDDIIMLVTFLEPHQLRDLPPIKEKKIDLDKLNLNSECLQVVYFIIMDKDRISEEMTSYLRESFEVN